MEGGVLARHSAASVQGSLPDKLCMSSLFLLQNFLYSFYQTDTGGIHRKHPLQQCHFVLLMFVRTLFDLVF